MPTITINREVFEQYVGKKFTVDKLKEKYVLDNMFISMKMMKDVIGGIKLR